MNERGNNDLMMTMGLGVVGATCPLGRRLVETLLAAGRRLDAGVAGSIFGGRGSVLGVTAQTFEDEDHIKNALVQ